MTTTALLLSGTGRYADPWHPFAETSAALASLLANRGVAVTTADDVDAALASLAAPDGGLAPNAPDLLAVNVGLPRDGEASPGSAAALAGLQAWADSARPLLAVHSSSTSFVDAACWREALGGQWVRGTTMHPPYGHAQVRLNRTSLTEGLEDFAIEDERYSWLSTADGVEVHAWHEHEGEQHPLMWSHRRGPAKAFYDALGHDGASYESATHTELLARGVDWLLD